MNPSILEKVDLVVLGGGPAGTSGATAAGLLGKRVALVEKAALVGGAGINTGTIPSKTLRETSLMLSGWRSRRLFVSTEEKAMTQPGTKNAWRGVQPGLWQRDVPRSANR